MANFLLRPVHPRSEFRQDAAVIRGEFIDIGRRSAALAFQANGFLTRRRKPFSVLQHMDHPVDDPWIAKTEMVAIGTRSAAMVFQASGQLTVRRRKPFSVLQHLDHPVDDPWITRFGDVYLAATQWPALDFFTRSFRNPPRRGLDLRFLEGARSQGWLLTGVTTDLTRWSPALDFLARGFRPGQRRGLDLRFLEHPSDLGWLGAITQAVEFPPSLWPAVEALWFLRVPRHTLMDPRWLEQPQIAWIFANLPAVAPALARLRTLLGVGQ